MFYNDSVKSNRVINMNTVDANECYLKHYQIALLLRATVKNAVDFNHKAIAREQLTIAERKLSFWERHKNFDISSIMNRLMNLKKCDMSQVCVNL